MRVTGWAELLMDFIASRKATPFAYGAHDCCLYSADAAIVVCGVDFAEPVRGYSTQEEAQIIIDGFGGMQAMVTALMGAEPVAMGAARRGDLVLAVIAGAETIGICVHNVCSFARLGGGVVSFPRSVGTMAWRVD